VTVFEEIEPQYSVLITNERLIIVEDGSEKWSVLLKGLGNFVDFSLIVRLDITEVDLAKTGTVVKFNHEPSVSFIRETSRKL
jgi:hypothetical protein